jgi:hypothetical protein
MPIVKSTDTNVNPPMELTVFKKTRGILTKRISLLKSGKISADGSECRMGEGRAYRTKLDSIDALATLIEKMPANEALALGRLRAGLPDRVRVIRKVDLDDSTASDTIARTGENLEFPPGLAAYMLLDHDCKGIPDEIWDKLGNRSFWKNLVMAIPALAGATRLERRSTSSGLYHQKRPDEPYSGTNNRHVYVLVTDGSDIKRALTTLQDRLWLAGYGYYVIGANGSLLERSIIDASVYGPERLVFEGEPIVEAPLAQDAKARRADIYDGNVVDTRVAIPPLNEAELQQLAEIKREAAMALKPRIAAARQAWADAYAERHGLTRKEAERIAAQAGKLMLETTFELEFDDPDLGDRTVAKVLNNPDRYLGETLADPIEGYRYGRGKAKVLRRRDRTLMIHSFAHGGISYQLAGQGVRLEDFRAHKYSHKFFYTPTGEAWPAISVDRTVPPVPLFDDDGAPVCDADGEQIRIPASQWLDKHQSVEQITWLPGAAMLIEDRLVDEGGWFKRLGVTCLNIYRPPDIELGDAEKAGPWLDHVHRIYPDDAKHIIDWLAHRVQHPDDKINHALVLGGSQGIGKDTLLEPVSYAVGLWNFKDASPEQVMGRFNGFLKSVILRINEARDLGNYDRYKFYNKLKGYTAAPPKTLRIDEKNLPEHYAFNVCGVIITTNHKTDGIHLDANDRRHYVAWSDEQKESFAKDYWNRLWGWYEEKGGIRHVTAHLARLDLSGFDAKAPPPKTAAWHAIVDVGRAPEEAELADVLDRLNNPPAVIVAMLTEKAHPAEPIHEWLKERKNRRVIPHRLEACGYVQVRNETVKDGYFKIGKKRHAVYAKAGLAKAEQLRAARELVIREAKR